MGTGDQIIVWECNGQAAQEWIWAGDSSGNYYIKYKSDTTKCMTVTCDTGKSDCSGTKVTFEDCTDSSYQHFGGANGHGYFQGSSQVVDAGAWPLSNGLGLYVYDENGNPQQNWEYGDDLDHFYNSDSQAALAAEETPTALPPSEDVNTTTEDAKLQHQHLQASDDCPYSDGFNIKDLVCLWQYQTITRAPHRAVAPYPRGGSATSFLAPRATGASTSRGTSTVFTDKGLATAPRIPLVIRAWAGVFTAPAARARKFGAGAGL